MPRISIGDCHLYYERHGAGFPILLVTGLAGTLLLTLLGWDLARWSLVFLVAIVLLPVILSIRSAWPQRALSQVAPLTFLFLTFGFARVACLIRLRCA